MTSLVELFKVLEVKIETTFAKIMELEKNVLEKNILIVDLEQDIFVLKEQITDLQKLLLAKDEEIILTQLMLEEAIGSLEKFEKTGVISQELVVKQASLVGPTAPLDFLSEKI